MIRRNVLANSTSRLWAAAVSLAAVPFYVRFLGIEAYGVIGLYLALGPILSVLDLGLGTTLTRRVAQLSLSAGNSSEIRDLVRTLEALYWTVGIVLGIGLAVLAPLIAASWIQPEHLQADAIAQALVFMGIALACQWPLALYTGGLVGMQRQVLASALSAAIVTVRNVGAVIVLWQVDASLQAFFAWQILVSLAETLLTAWALWRSLPAGAARPRARLSTLREVWRFAAGVSGISLLAVVLTQIDKIILSRVLPLAEFGYYSLAYRVAVGLFYLAGPVNTAFFPRFAQLALAEDKRPLARLYHAGCQLLSVAVVPLAIVVAVFPAAFLQLWLLDPDVVRQTSPILRLLMIGTALNALMTLPLALQLAHGATRLVLCANAAAVVLLVPLIYAMSVRHGALGAAWVWIGLNAAYVAVLLPLMHGRLLEGELRHWIIADVGLPLAASAAVVWIYANLATIGDSYLATALHMIALTSLAILASVLAAPELRTWILRFLRPGIR